MPPCRSVMEVDCGLRKSCGSPFVAPVTGPRRAVTHCDRACTNAQRPNTPQVLRYPDRCSLSATTAAVLSSSPPFVRNVRDGYAPQPSHTPPTHPREPSSLHQPAPRTLFAPCSQHCHPIEASSWSKHLRFRDLPHKVAQESIRPLCIERAASAVLLSYPALCPCAPRPHFVFTLLPLFISYFHLLSSLRTTLCLLSSPLLDSLYCEMCKKQDLRADLS